MRNTALLLSPLLLVAASHAFVSRHVAQARGVAKDAVIRAGTFPSEQHRRRTHVFSTAVTESAPPAIATNIDGDEGEPDGGSLEERVSFSHLHIYVDSVADVDVYKKMEANLNQLSFRIAEMREENAMGDEPSPSGLEIEKCRKLYDDITGRTSSDNLDQEFIPQGRDVVKQLLSGLGFRVTGKRMVGSNTKSVLVTTKDPNGVQVVVTALNNESTFSEKDKYEHFDASNLQRFYESHSNRQGIAILAFEVTSGSIDTIYKRYMEMHPKLVTPQGVQAYGDGTKVLEVYAYYQGDVRASEADVGTVLRFIQKGEVGGNSMPCILPGLEPVDAVFDPSSQAAYCDHWVSNVISRTGFIDTLEDVFQFTPKVDFNAGVVAAGEAQIESTVTGNDSPMTTTETDRALRDQSQVYLPINNALSEVGHVHGFLQEIGQGIQHCASRVNDLPSFVQRGNDYRKITGEGLTFLNIPRSYYGVLMESQFDRVLSPPVARAVMESCEASEITSAEGAVDLDLAREAIARLLDGNMPHEYREEYSSKKDETLDIIMRSRYTNLYSLLRNHLTEEAYLKIVRNKILVDVQGDDLLLQIFTSNILQRQVGEEAPFFEYIQRVCSECLDEDGCPAVLKPGCGGFGIRNFLTLFLSIEVSKAMVEASQAKASGDKERQAFGQTMVAVFTAQLNESNPILTEISDAMTLEGNLQTQFDIALANNDPDAAQRLRSKLDEASKAKAAGNKKLMECSTKYKEQMRALRESRGSK